MITKLFIMCLVTLLIETNLEAAILAFSPSIVHFQNAPNSPVSGKVLEQPFPLDLVTTHLYKDEPTIIRTKRGLTNSRGSGSFRSTIPSGTRPRSNSLPSTFSSTSIGSLSTPQFKTPISLPSSLPRSNSFSGYQLPPLGKPLNPSALSPRLSTFGMDRDSSASSSRTISPNLSPVAPASSSRRGSFGLQDQMELLSLNSKTPAQLRNIDKWETRPINSGGLNDNCYYCTAAGLSGRSTDRMVKKTETMQNRLGSITDTTDLLKQSYFPKVQSRVLPDSTSLHQYLDSRLQPGQAARFGVAYQNPVPLNANPANVPGHMVGMKAWKNPDGSLGTRRVDFQLPPSQRFPPEAQNWLPPTNNFHLIDLYPVNPMLSIKRNRQQQQIPEDMEIGSKRHRTTGNGQ